jgi:L-amino acid N-acyltransferase YncA
MIYDCTYQFIKGTLNAYPDGVEVSAATAKDTPVSMKLFDEEKANLAVELVASPAHGSVTLGNDGILTYYPEAGFTGTVTVTFTYNEGLGESDICTATITVE